MTDDRARDEALLVRRLAAGDDPAAWSTFVDRYGPLLQALARRMLTRRAGSAPDADVDEIVAEVFLALLRRERRLLERYDPSYRLATYLGVICRTAVLRHLRRRGRAETTLVEPGAVAATSASPQGLEGLLPEERERVLARLRDALARLAPRDRLLLTLRFLDGLDYRAIAEALDVSPDSVGPLLSRAKARLAAHAASLADLLADDA